jgi:hypothetical protein
MRATKRAQNRCALFVPGKLEREIPFVGSKGSKRSP